MTVPPQSVHDHDLWETVPPQDYSGSSQKFQSSKSSVPITTKGKKQPTESISIVKEQIKSDMEPKKRFIPFNQKAVDRAAGIKLPASLGESNLQDQRDELLALRSIFDKDFQKEEGNTLSDQPSPNDIYRIKIKPVGAGNSAIELRFSYPPTYPSHGPPAISVTSDSWLTPYAIQLLQHHLDKLLQESETQVVVYTLATWIQEESWSYLMSRSSFSNPIVIHFSPLPMPKRISRSANLADNGIKPTPTQQLQLQSQQQQQQQFQFIKFKRGDPLIISEGKHKISIVVYYANVRTLTQVAQLIKEIKEKKPTSPKQGQTEQYLVAYRFAATERSLVNEGSDGEEYGAGGASESILRVLQKSNLYDISVVVRLRWSTYPSSDVYKKNDTTYCRST